MFTRREFLQISGLTLTTTAAWPNTTARRRALVIGIDEYRPAEGAPVEGKTSESASASASVQRGRQLGNLDGAVNDAMLMSQILKDRFAFQPNDIVLLTNKQATRDRILHEFKAHLIDAAAPGDVSLFYYAGHGSQVINLGSDESDQHDETLVPADVYAGAPDIRDKEMARLYRDALQKRIALSVVLDSCHSGGMSRGSWNAGGKIRSAPPDSRTVNDPPDTDPVTRKKLPDPSEMGMLFIAAARKDQPAGETTIVDRGSNKEIAHGAFTAALARVLQSPVSSQSLEQICERVQAMLASEGRTQVPICGGNNRKSRGLLGQDAGTPSAITLSAEGLTGEGLVRLRGGSALGLAPGCTLSRIGGKPIRLELVRVELASSEAKLMAGTPPSSVQAGDLFELETWIAPPDATLKVYFQKYGVDDAAVLRVAGEIQRLSGQSGYEVITAPMRGKTPTHVIFYRQSAYFLEAYPHTGATTNLGSLPTAEQIRKALGNSSAVRLWAILPPTHQVASQLNLGAGTTNAGVRVVADPSDGTYFLAGRPSDSGVEYCWFFKDALSADPDQARLPLRTDYEAVGSKLTGLALRLAKIYAWLNMNGPAGGDVNFPYHLIFEKFPSHQPAGTGPFRFGEKYKFVLEATPEALKLAAEAGGVSRRYVYIFLIDSTGEATCFFPMSANGNVQNLLPRGEPTPRITATPAESYDVEISEPAGTDNYFMVASEQPIDPGVFEWNGVSKRGTTTALDLMFSSLGTGSRGGKHPQSVPVTWSIQSLPIRSIPPK